MSMVCVNAVIVWLEVRLDCIDCIIRVIIQLYPFPSLCITDMSSNAMVIDDSFEHRTFYCYKQHVEQKHLNFPDVAIQSELKFKNIGRVIDEGCLFCLQMVKHCPYLKVDVWSAEKKV